MLAMREETGCEGREACSSFAGFNGNMPLVAWWNSGLLYADKAARRPRRS